MTEFTPALALQAALVTEMTAVNAARLIGRGDEKAADQAAVDAMRNGLNAMPIKGRVVIGEGERDEAPMLFIGEEVGLGTGPEVDVALDPLEGTTITAKAMPNALAVMAFAPKGGFLNAPDVYMEKLAVGPGYAPGIIDISASPADNIRAVAKAKGVSPEEIGVCVLDRARHGALIDELRDINARVHLISDGDVQGIINTTSKLSGIDIYMGSGGAPEGVLAASALRCIGGQIQGKLLFRNNDEAQRARNVGIDDLDKVYDIEGLAKGPTIFTATGVTHGTLVDGVRFRNGKIHTETLIMNSIDGSVQRLRSVRRA